MRTYFRLEGLCCANCAANIEKAVGKLPNVRSASVNLMTTRIAIEHNEPDAGRLMEEVGAIARAAEPDVVVKKA
jgi:copper chaperone CopZ